MKPQISAFINLTTNHKTKDVSKDRLAHTTFPQRQARSGPAGFQKNLHPPLSGSIF
jgi:hypothetical protein